MIPLRDVSRRPLHFPAVTSLIIVINVAAFVLELVGGETFIKQWSMVPADIVAGHNWITIFSAMFLHAGLVHIVGNMLFLWVFGPEIEDVI
jgi:membrane associated rhomboid family serine protease